MNVQVKLIAWDNEKYLIMIGRGQLDRAGMKEIFDNITAVTQEVVDCNALIDLHDVTSVLNNSDIDSLLAESHLWSSHTKVVFVCPAESRQFFQLIWLSKSLEKRGCSSAVLSDSKAATDWLRGP